MIDRLADRLGATARPLGQHLARRAAEAGLSVTLPDGTARPIRISCLPVVLTRPERERRARQARVLATATVKVAQWAVAEGRTEVLFALSPLERSYATVQRRAELTLATVRLDCLTEHGSGELRALEANATIPAMQGYSDIAAESFIATLGEQAGLPSAEVSRLLEENGSNAHALLDALIAGHRLRSGREPRSIALLCRRNDSQLGELRFLAKRFDTLGVRAQLAHPEELTFGDKVQVRGEPVDLVYRHLFVRRLETGEAAPELKAFYAGRLSNETVLLNPPASQVEAKSTFALLSTAASDDAMADSIGLTPEERKTVLQLVPWTRVFRSGAVTGLGGERWEDLVQTVSDQPERFVLKRAWGYGGSSVFLGPPSDDLAARKEWSRLCHDRAQEAGGGYVVQERVALEPVRHWLCDAESVVETPLYVDYSAYASVGIGPGPAWSGVCRGAPSPIVNIATGGGLVPLLDQEVAERLVGSSGAGTPPWSPNSI